MGELGVVYEYTRIIMEMPQTLTYLIEKRWSGVSRLRDLCGNLLVPTASRHFKIFRDVDTNFSNWLIACGGLLALAGSKFIIQVSKVQDVPH